MPETTLPDHISQLLRLPNAARGEYAVEVVNSEVSPEIRREVLIAAWEHDYVHVWRAAGNQAAFNRLWRRAGFSVSHLSFPLTVWRGGRNEDWIDVAIGLSWTLDRDTACWFAMRPAAHAYQKPFVVRRVIRYPRQVLAHTNDRGENEIIVANPAGLSDADGTIDDWTMAANRVAERRQADHR